MRLFNNYESKQDAIERTQNNEKLIQAVSDYEKFYKLIDFILHTVYGIKTKTY